MLREDVRPIVEEHSVPGLDFVFRTGTHVHYKSPMMSQLDDSIGDVKFEIVDIESNIRIRVEKIILERSEMIMDAVRALAQLDW